MTDYTRLFDIIPYQLENSPIDDCLAYKIDEKWHKYSTRECVDMINKVSTALLAKGLKVGDKIAIISNNRPEWNFVDNGMMQVGMINIPIYPTISEADYKYIFNQAEIKLAFVSNDDLFDKINHIRKDVPTLQDIYSFEKVDGCKHFDEFLAFGDESKMDEVKHIAAQIKPADLATIIYTSGTTGLPKGVMLSHDNVVSNVKSTLSCLPIESGHKTLSFLPLCHIFERMVTYTYFAAGAGIYYAESMETIGENLKEVKPHFFSTVPRLLEKVYEKIVNKGLELRGTKRNLFFWALNLGLQFDLQEDKGWWYRFRLGIARKLIFSKWKEALGGNIMGIVTGSAALQDRLGRVFSAAGIPIREGYGQTESSPVITFNRFEEGGAMFGTVGVPIPGVEVKLGKDDEILCKGPNVMMGYYKNPVKTAETIDEDGWLHTGDVGKWVGEGNKFLKITDRIKELFKTSGGKYVAPNVIENKMKESNYIEQIMVLGENQKFVSALIIPAFVNIAEWCTKNAVEVDGPEEMVQHNEIKKLFREEIDELNKNFGHVEQIKKFELLPKEWTIEDGELTPTMKVKRKVVYEKYSNIIADIYN